MIDIEGNKKLILRFSKIKNQIYTEVFNAFLFHMPNDEDNNSEASELADKIMNNLSGERSLVCIKALSAALLTAVSEQEKALNKISEDIKDYMDKDTVKYIQ